MTAPSPDQPGRQPRWTRQQIRAARQAPLVPLLRKRSIDLIEQEAGNFQLPAYPGLIVKDSYWRWPQRNMAGNTIDDFFVQVLGLRLWPYGTELPLAIEPHQPVETGAVQEKEVQGTWLGIEAFPHPASDGPLVFRSSS